MARRLAALCRSNGLVFLIAADAELAQRCGADGVHWPERLLPASRGSAFQVVIGAAHSNAALSRAAAAGLDASVLSPVFPTESSAHREPIGLFRSSQWARGCAIPVIALGGVSAQTARRFAGRAFAGLAAVGALAGA